MSAVRDCLFSIFGATLHIWRPFLHPQPENATWRGDRDPLITEIKYSSVINLGKSQRNSGNHACVYVNTCTRAERRRDVTFRQLAWLMERRSESHRITQNDMLKHPRPVWDSNPWSQLFESFADYVLQLSISYVLSTLTKEFIVSLRFLLPKRVSPNEINRPIKRGVWWWRNENAACQKMTQEVLKWSNGHPWSYRFAEHISDGGEQRTSGEIEFGKLKSGLGKFQIPEERGNGCSVMVTNARVRFVRDRILKRLKKWDWCIIC